MTMTGVGCRAINRRRNEKPSIFGISRSSVMTSGASWKAIFRPSSPSPARPTTWNPGTPSSKAVMVWRLNAESSTTRMRMGLSIYGLSVNHIVLQVHQIERGRQVDQRLRVAEQQIAAADQLAMQRRDHLLARRLIEVDEHVAAEDDVDVA